MAKYRTHHLGGFGSTIRFVLMIVNFLFFIIGLVLCITACILKWGTSLTKLIDIDEVKDIVNSESINNVATLLLILSVFIMIVSLIGFVSVKFMNRKLMLIYEIVVGVVFLIHVIAVLVIVFGWSSLEKEFRDGFSKIIDSINTNSSDFQVDCNVSHDISALFKCCGAEGPDDFVNHTLVETCCKSADLKTPGCSTKVVNALKDITHNLLIVPSIILFIIEFLALVFVPLLMRRVKSGGGYDSV